MPEDLKLSQIGSSQLPPPFRGLHTPGVQKHCQIIFACYFRKSSVVPDRGFKTASQIHACNFEIFLASAECTQCMWCKYEDVLAGDCAVLTEL